MILESKGEKST